MIKVSDTNNDILLQTSDSQSEGVCRSQDSPETGGREGEERPGGEAAQHGGPQHHVLRNTVQS